MGGKEVWMVRVVVLLVALAVLRTTAFADVDCRVSHTDLADRAACRAQLERQWQDAVAEEKEVLKAMEKATRSGGEPSEASDANVNLEARMETVVKQREELESRFALFAASPEEAFHVNHCERPLTICYDRDGELFSYGKGVEVMPAAVRVGDKVAVLVLTQQKDNDASMTVTFLTRRSQERLLADAPPSESPVRAEKSLRSTNEPRLPPSYDALRPFVSDPVPDDVVDFTITIQRRALGKDKGIDKTDVIFVDLGYSYYSVALLVAATFKGDHHVLRDLSTTSDHAVDPGLALNVFPFGRQRGRIGYLAKCRLGGWAQAGRCAANMIGFQLGADLDLTNPTDKLYAGVVFEPVAGLALVGGVTLRKVAVVPPAGALPVLEAMDGSSPEDTRYVTRGYVGITITLDLLNTISSVGAELRNVKVP